MTPAAYWQALDRYHQGLLTPAESYHYQVAGILAESAARERGCSLLPASLCQPDVLPQQLERETLIVLGLTMLVLADLRP